MTCLTLYFAVGVTGLYERLKASLHMLYSAVICWSNNLMMVNLLEQLLKKSWNSINGLPSRKQFNQQNKSIILYGAESVSSDNRRNEFYK